MHTIKVRVSDGPEHAMMVGITPSSKGQHFVVRSRTLTPDGVERFEDHEYVVLDIEVRDMDDLFWLEPV